MPLFETAAREVALEYLPADLRDGLDPIQIILASKLNPVPIRNLTVLLRRRCWSSRSQATSMSRLVQVPGIVIRYRRASPASR